MLPYRAVCCIMALVREGDILVKNVAFAKWHIAATLVVVGLLVVACNSQEVVIPPTPTAAPTFTPGPTALPARATEPPPGSQENPLSLFLVSSDSPASLSQEILAVNDALAAATNVSVDVQVVDNYALVVEGLCDRTIHIGSLDAFSYLIASQRGCVTPALVAEIDGAVAVQGQIIANVQREVGNVAGFQGLTFCRPDAQSVYGWLMPSIAMRASGLDPLRDLSFVVDAGSDENVVRMVHDLDCDIGATMPGVLETVDNLALPGSVVVIETLTPVPNDVIVFGNVVSEGLRDSSLDAFDEASAELMDILGADGLSRASDASYNDLRDLLDRAGIDIFALAR